MLLARPAQQRVGRVDLRHPPRRRRVPGPVVRVEALGELAVGVGDLVGVGVARDAESGVGIHLGAPLCMARRVTPDNRALMDEIELRGEMIRLGQLLKAAGLAGSGADAKTLIADGGVRVNGEVELRRGRQLHRGDVVAVGDAVGTPRLIVRAEDRGSILWPMCAWPVRWQAAAHDPPRLTLLAALPSPRSRPPPAPRASPTSTATTPGSRRRTAPRSTS